MKTKTLFVSGPDFIGRDTLFTLASPKVIRFLPEADTNLSQEMLAGVYKTETGGKRVVPLSQSHINRYDWEGTYRYWSDYPKQSESLLYYKQVSTIRYTQNQKWVSLKLPNPNQEGLFLIDIPAPVLVELLKHQEIYEQWGEIKVLVLNPCGISLCDSAKIYTEEEDDGIQYRYSVGRGVTNDAEPEIVRLAQRAAIKQNLYSGNIKETVYREFDFWQQLIAHWQAHYRTLEITGWNYPVNEYGYDNTLRQLLLNRLQQAKTSHDLYARDLDVNEFFDQPVRPKPKPVTPKQTASSPSAQTESLSTSWQPVEEYESPREAELRSLMSELRSRWNVAYERESQFDIKTLFVIGPEFCNCDAVAKLVSRRIITRKPFVHNANQQKNDDKDKCRVSKKEQQKLLKLLKAKGEEPKRYEVQAGGRRRVPLSDYRYTQFHKSGEWNGKYHYADLSKPVTEEILWFAYRRILMYTVSGVWHTLFMPKQSESSRSLILIDALVLERMLEVEDFISPLGEIKVLVINPAQISGSLTDLEDIYTSESEDDIDYRYVISSGYSYEADAEIAEIAELAAQELGYPGKPAKESVYREADVWRRLLQKQSDHYQALEIKNWWPLASEEEGTNRKLILQVLANTLKGLYPRNMHLSEYFEPEETDKEASSSINQKTSWHDFLPQP